MTGEHLWSEWKHPFLPKLEAPKKNEFYRVVRGKYGPTETVLKKPQQGHTYTKTIRAVCHRCNTGWMSGVEGLVKPILIPMLQGQRFELDRISQHRLAVWITLKMLVAENQNVEDRVIQNDGLAFFRAYRTVPRGTKIWIAHHDTPEWYAGYGGQTLQATLDANAPTIRGLKNIQATGFGVGHLFALTCFSALPTFEIEFDEIEKMGVVRRLWPLRPGTITWPMRTVSDGALDRLSHLIEHIIRAPFSHWRN
jgi:hypothetical protein